MNTKHIIAVSLTALAFSLVGCAVDTESSEPYELETTGIQQAAATAGEACGNDGDTRVDTDENGCTITTVTRCAWTPHTSPPTYIYKKGTNGRVIKRIIPGTDYLSCDCIDLSTKDCPEDIEGPLGP